MKFIRDHMNKGLLKLLNTKTSYNTFISSNLEKFFLLKSRWITFCVVTTYNINFIIIYKSFLNFRINYLMVYTIAKKVSLHSFFFFILVLSSQFWKEFSFNNWIVSTLYDRTWKDLNMFITNNALLFLSATIWNFLNVSVILDHFHCFQICLLQNLF